MGQSTVARRSKQMEQFEMQDVIFFDKNARGRLYQIPHNAQPFKKMNAKCVTLKLDNQKNGWKGVCLNHEHNGDKGYCAIRGLGRQYLHIRKNTMDQDTLLSE